MNDVKVDSNDIEEMYIKYYTPLKRYCRFVKHIGP